MIPGWIGHQWQQERGEQEVAQVVCGQLHLKTLLGALLRTGHDPCMQLIKILKYNPPDRICKIPACKEYRSRAGNEYNDGIFPKIITFIITFT